MESLFFCYKIIKVLKLNHCRTDINWTYSWELKFFRTAAFVFIQTISICFGEIIQSLLGENIKWLKSQYCFLPKILSNKLYLVFVKGSKFNTYSLVCLFLYFSCFIQIITFSPWADTFFWLPFRKQNIIWIFSNLRVPTF